MRWIVKFINRWYIYIRSDFYFCFFFSPWCVLVCLEAMNLKNIYFSHSDNSMNDRNVLFRKLSTFRMESLKKEKKSWISYFEMKNRRQHNECYQSIPSGGLAPWKNISYFLNAGTKTIQAKRILISLFSLIETFLIRKINFVRCASAKASKFIRKRES